MVWQQITVKRLPQRFFQKTEVTAIADVKMGEYDATAWGCDLTHEYVSINADYRS